MAASTGEQEYLSTLNTMFVTARFAMNSEISVSVRRWGGVAMSSQRLAISSPRTPSAKLTLLDHVAAKGRDEGLSRPGHVRQQGLVDHPAALDKSDGDLLAAQRDGGFSQSLAALVERVNAWDGSCQQSWISRDDWPMELRIPCTRRRPGRPGGAVCGSSCRQCSGAGPGARVALSAAAGVLVPRSKIGIRAYEPGPWNLYKEGAYTHRMKKAKIEPFIRNA